MTSSEIDHLSSQLSKCGNTIVFNEPIFASKYKSELLQIISNDLMKIFEDIVILSNGIYVHLTKDGYSIFDIRFAQKTDNDSVKEKEERSQVLQTNAQTTSKFFFDVMQDFINVLNSTFFEDNGNGSTINGHESEICYARILALLLKSYNIEIAGIVTRSFDASDINSDNVQSERLEDVITFPKCFVDDLDKIMKSKFPSSSSIHSFGVTMSHSMSTKDEVAVRWIISCNSAIVGYLSGCYHQHFYHIGNLMSTDLISPPTQGHQNRNHEKNYASPLYLKNGFNFSSYDMKFHPAVVSFLQSQKQSDHLKQVEELSIKRSLTKLFGTSGINEKKNCVVDTHKINENIYKHFFLFKHNDEEKEEEDCAPSSSVVYPDGIFSIVKKKTTHHPRCSLFYGNCLYEINESNEKMDELIQTCSGQFMIGVGTLQHTFTRRITMMIMQHVKNFYMQQMELKMKEQLDMIKSSSEPSKSQHIAQAVLPPQPQKVDKKKKKANKK